MSRKKSGNGRRHGGWSNTLIGGDAFISIFCRGTSTQPHQKWRLGSLHPDEWNGEAFWTESVSGYADHERDTYFRTLPTMTQYLVGDQWLEQAERRDHRDDPHFRARWSMRCPKCEFGQVFRDTRQYTNAIDQLAQLRSQDGILEIPLRVFTAHLRRSPRNEQTQ